MHAETQEHLHAAVKNSRTHDLTHAVFSTPREFLGNHFVYVVVSPRARGLSIGVNMNPDKHCNFNCEYCEVDRTKPPLQKTLDVDLLSAELLRTLGTVATGAMRGFQPYRTTPKELLELRQVALSGDGEPTLCPNFLDALRTVIHVRALGRFPFFKIVLITNATGLHLPQVQEGLKMFTHQDEIWAKLDAGTQSYMEEVNRPECSLEKILENILLVARLRPVVIQSLFRTLNDEDPSDWDVHQFAQRLNELKRAGAQIPLVQIYSATRPSANSKCGHLSLKSLAYIAQQVREISGLKAEVF
jgi:wyosine [tRNA(Phe)-imidazoG37] synthetase (radical SAM superfamily)